MADLSTITVNGVTYDIKSKPLVVNISFSIGSGYSVDKTNAEVYAAYVAGKRIIGVLNFLGDYFLYNLVAATENSFFLENFIPSSDSTSTCGYLEVNNDVVTYSTANIVTSGAPADIVVTGDDNNKYQLKVNSSGNVYATQIT